jgi:hypothetical protein
MEPETAIDKPIYHRGEELVYVIRVGPPSHTRGWLKP